MSDFEDEMDVDAPAARDSVIFSSDASKGKRSAANLPVEAEDTLPWYEHALDIIVPANHSRIEKYRPESLDDVSGHQDILATINKFVDTNVSLPEKHIQEFS
jgi:replication factor C subunit 3/5